MHSFTVSPILQPSTRCCFETQIHLFLRGFFHTYYTQKRYLCDDASSCIVQLQYILDANENEKKTKQNNEKINKMKEEIESDRMVANRKWQCERMHSICWRVCSEIKRNLAWELHIGYLFHFPMAPNCSFHCKLQLIEWASEQKTWRKCVHKSWLGHCYVQCMYTLNVDIIGIDVIFHPSHSISLCIMRFHFFISSQCFSFSSWKK